jgi:hypothetical protein
LSVIGLIGLHFDFFTSFKWLDGIYFRSFEAAKRINEEDHEQEEYCRSNHRISKVAQEACQITNKWSEATFCWWSFLDRLG